MTIFVWCVEHEELVPLEKEPLREGHTFTIFNDPEVGLSSLDFHCMTSYDYAFCAPPQENADEFFERLFEIEPTYEELREIEDQGIREDLTWLLE